MLLQHIIDTIESAAPLKWQEAWDNSGLQVGDRNADIQRALLTIDLTEAVVNEAIDRHCDLIISHHPLLFHGLKQVTGQTPQARIVEQAILHHIAIYSSHTAIDACLHGVSGRMAEKIGLSRFSVLSRRVAGDGIHSDEGLSVLSRQVTTDGSPSDDGFHGLGVIGNLPQPVRFTDLLERIKQVFHAPYLRYTEPTKDTVQRLAICGGAGAEFIDEAIRQQADVYITADVKYHEFQNALGQIAVIDLDHWVSEQFTRDIFAEILANQVETVISTTDYSPIKIY